MQAILNSRGKSLDKLLKEQILVCHERIRTESIDSRQFYKGRLSMAEEIGKFFDRKFKLVIVQEEVIDKNE